MHSTRYFTFGISALALAVEAGLSAGVSSTPHRELLPLKVLGHAGPYRPPYVATDRKSKSGIRKDYGGSMPFQYGPDTALLLTDGTVIVHDICYGNWYKLTPDAKGKYENGTWSSIASMPFGYGPLYFASEILPDGRLFISGGEYNGPDGTCKGGDTNKGALYDPVANSWTSVSTPPGWEYIGDAPSVVLSDGSYMLGDCCSYSEVIATISGTTVTWTSTGSGKGGSNSETGWTNLPDGNLLTVDIGRDNDYEIYSTSSGTWTTPGQTASQLTDDQQEIGPAVLRPDGTVIQFGANATTGYNNVYVTSSGTWGTAPSFPVIDGSQYECADAPAALLPDGNVIVQASPPGQTSPSHFFEFSLNKKSGMNLTQVSDPKTAPDIAAYLGRFLELPTGQVLWTNSGEGADINEIATYTPKGKPKKEWLPVVSSVEATLTVGSTGNAISGTNFNGFSQGASYGDDAQESTNYPLIRITNTARGNVCFGRSYDFSTMGVWTTGNTNAVFDISANCETGAGTLQVVVNGLASRGVAVNLEQQ
jgi:hypothetical protein